jgi:hypothetical protein
MIMAKKTPFIFTAKSSILIGHSRFANDNMAESINSAIPILVSDC